MEWGGAGWKLEHLALYRLTIMLVEERTEGKLNDGGGGEHGLGSDLDLRDCCPAPQCIHGLVVQAEGGAHAVCVVLSLHLTNFRLLLRQVPATNECKSQERTVPWEYSARDSSCF